MTSDSTGAFDAQNAPTAPSPSAAATTLGPADLRRGTFQVLRRHAQGGLGLVSVALDVKLDRQVALKELAGSNYNLGLFLRSLGKTEEAEPLCRRALALNEKLAADYPNVPAHRREVARSQMVLGALLKDLGRLPEAEAAYRRSLAIGERLVADIPSAPQYRIELAAGYHNFGNLLRGAGQAETSLAWYAKSIALLTPVLKPESGFVSERSVLRDAYWNRAGALMMLGRHADAALDWDRARALTADGNEQVFFRVHRATCLARAGDHAKAVAEANAIAEAKDVTADTLYNLACVCGLASAAVKNDAKLQNEYAARAVELLRQAMAKGYKDIEHLKKDEDLKLLRERSDFQRLLREFDQPMP